MWGDEVKNICNRSDQIDQNRRLSPTVKPPLKLTFFSQQLHCLKRKNRHYHHWTARDSSAGDVGLAGPAACGPGLVVAIMSGWVASEESVCENESMTEISCHHTTTPCGISSTYLGKVRHKPSVMRQPGATAAHNGRIATPGLKGACLCVW